MNVETIKHPSYGMVGLSRVTTNGSRVLFGSTLASHHHTIVLRVHEAEMRIDRDLHMERACATRVPIVEVELSAAQFAELLTTMNVGDGIPCTLRSVNGKSMPDPPDVPVESANVRADFAAKMAKVKPDLARRARELMDELPASLKASTRRQIEIKLGNIVDAVAGNATFALDQFQQATARVASAAKAEIDAVVTHVVQATGIEALRQMRARGEVPALPEHKEPAP